MPDPYKTLGVGRLATADEIKKAYRKLAKKLHPDLNPGDKKIESQFKEISAAYDMLSDVEKRRKYDRGELDDNGNPRHPGFAAGGPWGNGRPGSGGPGNGGGGTRTAKEFGLDEGVELKIRQLQQLDGLLQLGRDHKALALPNLKSRAERQNASPGPDLAGTLGAIPHRLVNRGGSGRLWRATSARSRRRRPRPNPGTSRPLRRSANGRRDRPG